MTIYRAFPPWNSVGKARRGASGVSVWLSTALSLQGRCIGKARRDASEVSVRPSTALSLHGSQPPRKTIPLQKPPPASLHATSPQAPRKPPSKDPAEGFVDFFFGLVGVDVEVGVAGQHCGQVGLPAVVEDVAGGADLFGVGQFVADS